MPPQSKKKYKPIKASIISDLDQPQDYVDPLKKLAFNPGQTTAEKVVAAAGKRPAAKPRARVSKVARRLADQPAMQADLHNPFDWRARRVYAFIENARMTPAKLADYRLPDEREAEARRFEELTTVPDITLSATGAILPGSGLVLSSMMRYGYQGLNSSLALTGQVLQDVFGSDDMPTVLGSLGQALSNIAKESAPTFENYDIARPVKERGALDRTVGFLTQLGIQLPQMAVATALLGPAAGFGVYKAESLHAAGEQDAATLAGAFVQGAAEGALLSALGKTAQVVERSKGTNAVSKLLKKSPVAAQAGAQLAGGVAQTGVDGMLHPGQPAPDWLDYLHGGVANVIMDPVVLGGSGRSRKATQAATRMSGELDPSSYNLDLPPDNLAALRQDFWQPQDLPWDNRVTVGLLNKARVQLVDNPADPEGVLYLNPQAAAVIDRASQAVLPGSKIMSGVARGMSLPAWDAGLVAEHLLEKAAQFKETIKQLPDGDPKLNDLAMGAVVFESLAEHLQAATAAGERSAALRVLNKQKAADPANPVARAFDQTITGHESTHVQTDKIAKEMGVDPRATVSPGWLADHPIGAKVILGIGDSKSPLQGYDPVEWTNEAIAYAAQPGPDPGLGLTKQERGVLVGDYFAAVMDKHGPQVMDQVWVGRMDREVAQVAFKRLYESNRVRYSRDPVSGRRLGLEWRGVQDPLPLTTERVPDSSWSEVRYANQQQDPDYETVLPFYSGLERFIQRKVVGKVLPATQLISQLKNAGLRPGELEWTGVLDWLEGKAGADGKGKVGKDELLQELASRRVEVKDVWKGALDPVRAAELRAKELELKDHYGNLYSQMYRELRDLRETRLPQLNLERRRAQAADEWDKQDVIDVEIERVQDRIDKLERESRQIPDVVAKKLAEVKAELETVDKTRYTQFVQPGESSNYRELLLTLPSKPAQIDQDLGDAPRGWNTAGGETDSANYRSSHWDEPNILAHIRMTDRRGSQGEKVLFIEEVQSDWHQTGAKHGYHSTNKALKAKRQQLLSERDSLNQERKNIDFAEVQAQQLQFHQEAAQLSTVAPELQEPMFRELLAKYANTPYGKFQELSNRITDIEEEVRRMPFVMDGVPDGPFKKTWPELAMRRMIRYAAENGYDRVAWVRGEDADQSVGGKSGWFYDRNLVNTTNNIIKKYGEKVEYAEKYSDLDNRIEALSQQLDNYKIDYSKDISAQFQEKNRILRELEELVKQQTKLDPLPSRFTFEIPQQLRELAVREGQPIPLNIQPDPDYDAATPTTDVGGIDPDVTHLRQSNAPPEISEQVSKQREAERRAYRDVANLRARIKRNNDLAGYAAKMQQESGLPQPELDAEIQQRGEELKQQHVEAVKKFRELRQQGNALKASLAGQLSDNVQAKRAAAKLAAQGRLENGDELPPLDTPLDQVRMSNEYGNFLAQVAKDMLVASDVPIADPNEISTMDQLINAMKAGRTDAGRLKEVASRYGMQGGLPELFTRFRQFGSAAGRDLNVFSRQQRELNKLRGLSPELDEWINQQPPTMQELQAVADGAGIFRQLVNLNIGARIATLATQTPNVITGAINAVGVRSVLNLMDQAVEGVARTSRKVGNPDTEPAKFEQHSVPPLSKVLSPVFAASLVTKDLLRNPYWFAHGKLPDTADPAARASEKSIRIAQELHLAQADLMKKFDAQLSDDVIQIYLLPHAEAIQAQRDALTLYKNQIATMPAGADKSKLLAEVTAAEKRIAKTDQWLPKVLHEAARGLHAYLTLARMGERFVRTISLVSNLDREAARVGLNLDQLDQAGEVYKLPQEIVERAVNRALEDTYAVRPEPGSLTGQLYSEYAKSNHPGWVLTSAVFPFAGFMGNYARMVLDYSPLPLIKAALVGAGEEGATVNNHEKLIKATLGTAVYVATAALVKDKYDEAEREGKPVSSWHSVGGVSVRNIPQLVVPLYVADYMERRKRGLDAPEADTALEFFNILSGLDARNLTGTFKWLDDLINAGKDQSGNKGTKAAEAAATAFSDWFAGYLTPLNMYHDIAAQYWSGMRDVKDMYGMGAGSVVAPILNKVPVAKELLPDKIDPYTGMPVHRTDLPAVKAITGFTVLPAQSYPARIMNHAGIRLGDWVPFTGVSEVDRDLVAAVGKLVQQRTAILEATHAQQNLTIDEKIVDTLDVLRAAADDAFEEVLAKYPDIERRLEDAGEFNRWERRVEDKLRQKQGKPTLMEEQLKLKERRKP